jgi:hypothetical protein
MRSRAIEADSSLGFTVARSVSGNSQSVWLEVQLDPISRWVIPIAAAWLSGLALVVWLIGFRARPWNRGRRT